jgi:hypothetical protein
MTAIVILAHGTTGDVLSMEVIKVKQMILLVKTILKNTSQIVKLMLKIISLGWNQFLMIIKNL